MPTFQIRPMIIAIGLVSWASLSARAMSAEPGIEVLSGFQQTFAVSGEAVLVPGPLRRSRMGSDPTVAGEITIGLAPAGGAVGVAKLHVYERRAVAVGFTATVLNGSHAIATTKVSGCLDMDAWVGLPAETTSVRVSDLVPVKDGCK